MIIAVFSVILIFVAVIPIFSLQACVANTQGREETDKRHSSENAEGQSFTFWVYVGCKGE